MMSSIKGKDTQPELKVRRFLHGKGLRYRLHDRRLPGRPDLVFPRFRTVIFVQGCFWHRHKGCPYSYSPKSRRSFWKRKFAENIDRDRRNSRRLRTAGWRTLSIWECDLRKTTSAKILERLYVQLTEDR